MDEQTTCCMGSGINWTGPEFESGPVKIMVGYTWPEKGDALMCYGTFAQAQERRAEIQAWADANEIDLTAKALGGASILDVPIDGVTKFSWGFFANQDA